MPMRPDTHKTATSGAPRHAPERSTAAYDRTWQKVRLRKLKRNPICEECRREPARDVHHIKTVRSAPELRLDPANLMSLCRSCHSRKTAKGEH